MRPRTVIAGAAIAALAAALVALYIQVNRPGAANPATASGGEPATSPAPGDQSAEDVPVTAPEPPSPPRREAESASGSGSGAASSDEPRIYVRPVPGAKVPETIDKDSLADIEVQRDAAPEGSETAKVQSVTRLFNQRRYEEALDGALAVLDAYPDNFGMRRTVVSISCVLRDEQLAREHYEKLPEPLRRRAQRRCEKYGIELEQ